MTMFSQKGQSIVEFAFISPFFIFLFLAIVYGGILFIDFIQYNNAARSIARDASFYFQKNHQASFSSSELAAFQQKFHPLTSLYSATIVSVYIDSNNSTVTVTILLTRNEQLSLFHILSDDFDLQFPPKHLKPIVYTMPFERTPD